MELSNAVCSSEIHWLLGNGISLYKKVFSLLAGDGDGEMFPFNEQVGNTELFSLTVKKSLVFFNVENHDKADSNVEHSFNLAE